MKKLFFLSVLSFLLYSCSNESNVNSTTQSNSDSVISDQNLIYIGNAQTYEEPVENKVNDPLDRLRHTPITTEETIQNEDGSTTIRSTTTDGVSISTSENTHTPNRYVYSSPASVNIYSFQEAYNYSQKAFREPDDVEEAQSYLKKAMDFFSTAEAIAKKISCQAAVNLTSIGYSYAKKGHESDLPYDIELYARKAMDSAQDALNKINDCNKRK